MDGELNYFIELSSEGKIRSAGGCCKVKDLKEHFNKLFDMFK